MTTWKWLTDEQKAAMVADLQAGRPIKEIAQEYGRSEDGVRYVARRAGVPPRGPGKRPPEQFVESGQVFGRWTVLDPVAPRQGIARAALCRCECGTIGPVRIGGLLSGHAKSCGCFRRDASGTRLAELTKTHGLSWHPLYPRWTNMMHRCFDPAHDEYPNYGGRGITVHLALQWPPDYIDYIETLPVAAGLVGNSETIPCRELPENQYRLLLKKHWFSIDRIDNDGDYEPGNLRWADWRTQLANRRVS